IRLHLKVELEIETKRRASKTRSPAFGADQRNEHAWLPSRFPEGVALSRDDRQVLHLVRTDRDHQPATLGKLFTQAGMNGWPTGGHEDAGERRGRRIAARAAADPEA